MNSELSDHFEPVSKRPCRRRKIIKAPKMLELVKSNKELLELDDDCLCIVLEHLDVDSLCQMANVCKRFRPLTEEVFHRCHKEIKIQVCHEKSILRQILIKFGHSITALHLTGHHCNIRRRFDVNAIIEYCSNLRELYIYDVIVDCEEAKPLFARVTILSVRFCQLIGDRLDLFSNCFNVQKLVFSPDYCKPDVNKWWFLATRFPSLKEMAILNTWSLINDEYYIKMLLLNPQLEKLTVKINHENYTRPLLKYAPNLKSLHFVSDRSYFDPKEIHHDERLRYMKFDSFDSQQISEISKIKNLEILSLGSTNRNSESDFIHLVTELPLLTRLDLNFEYKSPTRITIIGVKNIIELGKQLDSLGLFGVKRMRIDQEVFEMLLKAVKSSERKKKFSIFITGCKSAVKINVPKAIQQAAKNQLEIFLNKYMEMDGDNRCKCKWCERKHTPLPCQEFPYV